MYHTVPSSLADNKNGLMRTGNKAKLLSAFKAETSFVEWISKLPSTEYETGLSYDGIFALLYIEGSEGDKHC